MNLLFIPERSGKGAVFHRKRLPDTTRLMNKVLLLLLLSLQVSAVSFGQQVSLNLHNAPVEQFFREIKKQTGYGFFYDEALPKQIGNISVTVNNVALQTALTEGFKDRPVDWRIVNKSIYLGLKNAPSSQNLAAVSGRVLDPEGAALPLATVKITPLGKGAVTDENGNFTIAQVPAGKYTIEVTSIGFQPYRSTLEVAGQDKNLGDLQLSIAVNELNEIAVVNTGYQSLSRERAAGSFGVLNTATLEKRNNYSLINYLQGQVPGLLVGSDGRMTIRGQSTFLADRSPLLVIDGFAVERDINTINPNDVESITVLKDASAASIWGVRASNGVIVIQTKRGAASRKPLDISFSTSLAYRTKPSLSDIPFASTGSFMDFEKYKVDNKLTTLYGKPRNAISPVADAWLNNPANAARIVDSLKQYHGLNEFSDLFMQSTLRQQYSLSLAAKGEKSSTRGSFSYDNVPSYMKNKGMKDSPPTCFNPLP